MSENDPFSEEAKQRHWEKTQDAANWSAYQKYQLEMRNRRFDSEQRSRIEKDYSQTSSVRCYICGEKGAIYRRRVYVGDNVRVYFGRRIGVSSGVSYGIRSLCPACASRHSSSNSTGGMVALIVVAFIVFLAAIGAFSNSSENSSHVAVEDIVTTTDAVNVRSAASASQPIVGTVQDGTKLKVQSRQGNWIKISYSDNGKNITGWISSRFVAKTN
ncbi:SH3 domain-containing protein [Geobacter pickeringii]|uniref:SH3 domain-containing protein n=1 Tax=Geobacter pickeringii TaxID=345632 RepID=UPI000A04C6FE|nr:SH3 domain-containing protein [Geobacter pickeringii]